MDDVEVQKAPAASRAHHRGRHLERIAEVRAGTRAEKVPYPIRIREARVRGIRMIGSGLLRVILGGPGTAGFESHAPDEHVKLIFPDPDGTLRVPEPDGLMLRWPRPMPTSREYTVRHYDAATGEIALDVALHPGGLGSDWAQAVEPGAVVHVAGPPAASSCRTRSTGTCSPATSPRCRRSHGGWRSCRGRRPAGRPSRSPTRRRRSACLRAEGVEVRWLHRGEVPPGCSDLLGQALRSVAVPQGERVHVWIAGEAGALTPLRRWVRDDLGVPRDDVDVTGYWKRGVADFDEEHEEPSRTSRSRSA